MYLSVDTNPKKRPTFGQKSAFFCHFRAKNTPFRSSFSRPHLRLGHFETRETTNLRANSSSLFPAFPSQIIPPGASQLCNQTTLRQLYLRMVASSCFFACIVHSAYNHDFERCEGSAGAKTAAYPVMLSGLGLMCCRVESSGSARKLRRLLFAMWLNQASFGSNFAVWAMRMLEVSFFVGLVGCALVVVVSWVSIVRSGFTKDTPSDI